MTWFINNRRIEEDEVKGVLVFNDNKELISIIDDGFWDTYCPDCKLPVNVYLDEMGCICGYQSIYTIDESIELEELDKPKVTQRMRDMGKKWGTINSRTLFTKRGIKGTIAERICKMNYKNRGYDVYYLHPRADTSIIPVEIDDVPRPDFLVIGKGEIFYVEVKSGKSKDKYDFNNMNLRYKTITKRYEVNYTCEEVPDEV